MTQNSRDGGETLMRCVAFSHRCWKSYTLFQEAFREEQEACLPFTIKVSACTTLHLPGPY